MKRKGIYSPPALLLGLFMIFQCVKSFDLFTEESRENFSESGNLLQVGNPNKNATPTSFTYKATSLFLTPSGVKIKQFTKRCGKYYQYQIRNTFLRWKNWCMKISGEKSKFQWIGFHLPNISLGGSSQLLDKNSIKVRKENDEYSSKNFVFVADTNMKDVRSSTRKKRQLDDLINISHRVVNDTLELNDVQNISKKSVKKNKPSSARGESLITIDEKKTLQIINCTVTNVELAVKISKYQEEAWSGNQNQYAEGDPSWEKQNFTPAGSLPPHTVSSPLKGRSLEQDLERNIPVHLNDNFNSVIPAIDNFEENNSNKTDRRKELEMPSELQCNEPEKKNLLMDPQINKFSLKYPVKLWKNLGLYEHDYLHQVNHHWTEFDPPSYIIHNILATIYGVFMVVGCGGNALVIFMFIRCPSLRSPPNYLIANLALSDFFMMAKTPIFIVNSIYRGPALGALGCKLYGFLGGLTGTVSIMSLATIALDRYYVIVYPLNPLKRITSKRAILMITGVWLYGALFSSLPLFGLNRYTSEGYLTSCSFDYLSEKMEDRVFIFVFFLAAWVFPLIIISFSYFHIYQAVKAAESLAIFESQLSKKYQNRFRYAKGKPSRDVKLAVLAAAIISLWVLAWTPYAVVALMGIFGFKKYLTPFASTVPALLCKTASCIDPFMYAINHPRFQKELKSKFKVCFVGYHRRQHKETKEGKDCEDSASRYSSISFRVGVPATSIRPNTDFGSPPTVSQMISDFTMTQNLKDTKDHSDVSIASRKYLHNLSEHEIITLSPSPFLPSTCVSNTTKTTSDRENSVLKPLQIWKKQFSSQRKFTKENSPIFPVHQAETKFPKSADDIRTCDVALTLGNSDGASVCRSNSLPTKIPRIIINEV